MIIAIFSFPARRCVSLFLSWFAYTAKFFSYVISLCLSIYCVWLVFVSCYFPLLSVHSVCLVCLCHVTYIYLSLCIWGRLTRLMTLPVIGVHGHVFWMTIAICCHIPLATLYLFKGTLLYAICFRSCSIYLRYTLCMCTPSPLHIVLFSLFHIYMCVYIFYVFSNFCRQCTLYMYVHSLHPPI